MIVDNPRLIMEFRELLSNMLIHVLFILIVFDILTGIVKGLWFKKEGDSSKGLPGLIKHSLVLLLVLVLYPYASILGFENFAIAIVVGYIAMYGISIAENFGQMGLWVPKWLKERLTKIKDKSDEEPKK